MNSFVRRNVSRLLAAILVSGGSVACAENLPAVDDSKVQVAENKIDENTKEEVDNSKKIRMRVIKTINNNGKTETTDCEINDPEECNKIIKSMNLENFFDGYRLSSFGDFSYGRRLNDFLLDEFLFDGFGGYGFGRLNRMFDRMERDFWRDLYISNWLDSQNGETDAKSDQGSKNETTAGTNSDSKNDGKSDQENKNEVTIDSNSGSKESESAPAPSVSSENSESENSGTAV